MIACLNYYFSYLCFAAATLNTTFLAYNYLIECNNNNLFFLQIFNTKKLVFWGPRSSLVY